MTNDQGNTSIQERPLEADGTSSSGQLSVRKTNPFRVAAEGLMGHPGWPDYLAARAAMKEHEEDETHAAPDLR